jgi:hypothetical protein
MARRFVSSRPLLGSALAGLGAFVVFAGICMIAGESPGASAGGGLFIGIAVGGALALRYLLSRNQQAR